MANKTRDVKLVLRAEDKAGKVLNDAVRNLKDFATTSEDVTASSVETGAAFGKLGASVAGFARDLKALDSLKKASAALDSQTAAVERFSASVERQKGTTAKLVSEYGAAAEATERFKLKARDATAAVRSQEDAVKQTVAALAELQGRQKGAASSFKVFESAELTKQRGELTGLKETLRTTNAELKRSEQSQAALRKAAESSTITTREQRAALGESKREMMQLSSVVTSASSKLGTASLDQNALGQAAEKAALNLEKVTAALKLQESAATGTGRQAQLGLQNSQLLNQIQAVRAARTEWSSAREEASKLGAVIANTANPTREMAQAQLVAAANTKIAKAEYIAQAEALNRLRGIEKGTFAQFQQRISGLNAQPMRDVADAAGKLEPSTRKLGSAFNELYGASRKSMSLFQRMRGEILALTASYVGLYAAFSQIDSTVKAFQTLEAVQNRLGAVFEGNTKRVAQEVTFLRDQAIRLGISFEVLGDEYSKLAVATNAAGFAQDSTRKIFLSVAEAGRVNKLSMENMSGIFLALQQMISKGKVSAEELQRQLGDRLPGAVNIMAQALGKTVPEMLALMQAGQLFANEDSMLKFADQLTKRFGVQLPAALQSMTTQMQRFQAIVFERRMQVGEGGFAAALQEAFSKLNATLSGEGGDKLVRAMTNAMTGLVKICTAAIENFSTLATVFQLFVAMKLARFFGELASQLVSAAKAQAAFGAAAVIAEKGALGAFGAGRVAAVQAFRAAVTQLTVAMTNLNLAQLRANGLAAAGAATAGIMRGALIGLAAAVRGLWVAMGGWLGVLIVVTSYLATSLFGDWISGVGSATEALDKHRRLLEEVRKGYEDVRSGAKTWAEALKGASEFDIKLNTTDLQKSLKKIKSEMGGPWLDGFAQFESLGARQTRKIFEPTIEAFRDGKISAQQLREEIDRIGKSARIDDNELAKKYRDLAVQAEAAEDAIKKNNAQIDLLNGKNVKASEAVLGLTTAVKDVNSAFDDAKAAEKFANTIEGLSKSIPKLANEMERLKKIKELDSLMEDLPTGERYAKQAAEAAARYQLAKDEVNINAFAGGKVDDTLRSTIALLKQVEGFQATGKWDANAYRAGYGSDTVTLSDGSIQAITNGMSVSSDDALRDLVRRVQTEFQPRAESMVGKEAFARFSDDQKAVLTSMAYNSANVLKDVAEVIKAGGSTQQIADAIRTAGKSLPSYGQLQGRRNTEAEIFSGSTAGNAASESARKISAEEFSRLLKEQNAERAREAALVNESARQQEIMKVLQEARVAAQKAGTALSKEDEASITRSAGAKYDALNKEKELEEAVTLATERRKLLMEQIQYYQSQGQVGPAEALKAQLVTTNVELEKAIRNAIAYWDAIGGDEAMNKVLQYQNALNTIKAANTNAITTAKEMNEKIAGGMSTAFDSFAKKVAEGANAFDALRESFLQFASDFLREIAQMIIKKSILMALGADKDGGGGGGGVLSGLLNGLFSAGVAHTGGIAGSVGTRSASPAWFANATRYHGGGIAGLKPNEVPTILERGEEILTANDPRHIGNGGGQQQVKVINTFDASSFLSEAMNSRTGEQIILNAVRSNPAAFKQALGT